MIHLTRWRVLRAFSRSVLVIVGALVANACAEIAAPRPKPPAKVLRDDCNTMFQDCGDPIYAPVDPPHGLQIGFSWNACITPSSDADLDGVDDNCEFAVARAFAPLLAVDGGDCDWDPGLNRLGGEYYFAVQRNDEFGPRLRIAYMPAYYKDCGADGHLGDSEFLLEDVSYAENSAGTAWQLRNVFTSAHCGTEYGGLHFDPDCQWWDATQFDLYGDSQFGYPAIWVASGKHSNYRSFNACNSAFVGTVDHCVSPYLGRFPIVYSWQNIGSANAKQMGTSLPARWGSSLTTPGMTESFWDAFWWFKGWNSRTSNTEGVTPYGQILAKYAHYWTPTAVPYGCDQSPTYVTC